MTDNQGGLKIGETNRIKEDIQNLSSDPCYTVANSSPFNIYKVNFEDEKSYDIGYLLANSTLCTTGQEVAKGINKTWTA